MQIKELETLIASFVQGEILIEDLNGGGDHFSVVVISESFEGIAKIDRQRKIMDPLQPRIASGEIHALTLKTYTPSQWKARTA